MYQHQKSKDRAEAYHAQAFIFLRGRLNVRRQGKYAYVLLWDDSCLKLKSCCSGTWFCTKKGEAQPQIQSTKSSIKTDVRVLFFQLCCAGSDREL